MFKKICAITLSAVCAVCMVSCSKDDSSASDSRLYEPSSLGEGEVSFSLEVTYLDGETESFNISTDKKTVGEALVELDFIDGEQTDLGLYVKEVNGITVDFDKDGKYWAFYIDGEYAMTGVDATDIEAGCSYAFKAE